MSLKIDPYKISEIIQSVAEAEILPHYQTLTAADISTKNGGELVTIADEAAERALSKSLSAALPGSVVLGEGVVIRNNTIHHTSNTGILLNAGYGNGRVIVENNYLYVQQENQN